MLSEATNYYLFECALDLGQRLTCALSCDHLAYGLVTQNLVVVMLREDKPLQRALEVDQHNTVVVGEVPENAHVLIVNGSLQDYQEGIITPLHLLVKHAFRRVVWIFDNRYREFDLLRSFREKDWLPQSNNLAPAICFIRLSLATALALNSETVHIAVCHNYYPQFCLDEVALRSVVFHATSIVAQSGTFYNDTVYVPKAFTLHELSLTTQVTRKIVKQLNLPLRVHQVDEK